MGDTGCFVLDVFFLSIYIFYVALDITLDSFEENAVYQRFKCPGYCLQVREFYKIIALI